MDAALADGGLIGVSDVTFYAGRLRANGPGAFPLSFVGEQASRVLWCNQGIADPT
jgi:hypothetical protein